MAFIGFSRETRGFLRDLAKNNNRDWFTKNKQRYQDHVEAPAAAFLDEISGRVAALCGGPVSGKVFRFYRDVRFSNDKTPYNTHVRIALGATTERGGECGAHPRFMFSLDPNEIVVGTGCMEFPKPKLAAYRDAVLDDATGTALQKLLGKYLGTPGYRIEAPALKRPPAGCPPDHPRVELAKYQGLTLWTTLDWAEAEKGAAFVGTTAAAFKKMKPLHDWLAAI